MVVETFGGSSLQSEPLTVYLGADDFSNFANPTKRTADVESVERSLLEWRDAGKLELVFALPHVLEVAPTVPEAIEFARPRLNCIKRLCGSRCLADPQRLLEHELSKITKSGVRHRNLQVHRNDGEWFPEIDPTGWKKPDIAMLVRDELAASASGNREARRKQKRTVFSGAGTLKAAAKQALHVTTLQAAAAIAQKYPLTESAALAISRYLAGKDSAENALAGIKESLTDLDCYGEWFELHWAEVEGTASWLRQIGEQLRHSIVNSAVHGEFLREQMLSSGAQTAEIARLFETQFDQQMSTYPNRFAGKMANAFGLGEPCTEIDCDTAPSFMAFAGVAAQVLRYSAFDITNSKQRRPRRSDFGDVLHSLYLPCVDVFRADGFSAMAIAQAHLPFTASVVSFKALVPTIQQRLTL